MTDTEEKNEENIRKETNPYRLKITGVIVLFLVIFILTHIFIITKYLPEIKEYSLGIIFVYVGLTVRSIVFRNWVDKENGIPLKLDKQKKLIRMTYEKNLIIVLAYSIILVFLIKELVICNLCEPDSTFIEPAIIGVNVVVGFHTDLMRILNIFSK